MTTTAGLNAYGLPTNAGRASSRNNLSSDGLSRNDSFHGEPPAAIGERIKVCVRKRPLSNKELQRNERDIADVVNSRCIVVNEPKYALFRELSMMFQLLLGPKLT